MPGLKPTLRDADSVSWENSNPDVDHAALLGLLHGAEMPIQRLRLYCHQRCRYRSNVLDRAVPFATGVNSASRKLRPKRDSRPSYLCEGDLSTLTATQG